MANGQDTIAAYKVQASRLIDIPNLRPGDVITEATIRMIEDIAPDEPIDTRRYLKTRDYVETERVRIGAPITLKCVENVGLEVMHEAVASVYLEKMHEARLRQLRFAHRRHSLIDMQKLTDEQRTRHENANLRNGRLIAVINKARRAKDRRLEHGNGEGKTRRLDAAPDAQQPGVGESGASGDQSDV